MNEEKAIFEASGRSKCEGGKYYKLETAGSCKITSDIDLTYLETAGMLKARGNIKAKKSEVAGYCSILGKIDSEIMEAAGYAKIKGGVHCKEFKAKGRIVTTSIEADSIYIEGSFRISGLINANDIKIYSEPSFITNCVINEIGGQNITIKAKNDKIVTVKSIEGNDIDIEHVRCKRVNGHNIKIGKNCNINVVEYSGDITVDDNANVKELIKID